MRPLLAAATLSLLLAHPAAAQELAPPRLVVRAAEAPVALTALDVRVVVQGLAAETTETLTFHNPNGRVLEGELEFPLPDGAAVTGFALDVDGALVDGVVVPKQQARVVLEAEVRRGVDPGLVEHVRGNVHRARVYPIPAHGTRMIRLRWLSPLATQGSDARYHLPLPDRAQLPSIALHVEVIRPPVTPEVKSGPGELPLARQGDRWVAEGHAGGSAAPGAGRDLLVRLPRLPPAFASVEAASGGEAFFSLHALLPAARQAGAPGPKRIAVAWDASGSRTRAATEKELAFLAQLLAAWPETAVDLVAFSDRPERPVAFAAGAARKLEAYLRALPADGGTGLGALDLRRPALPSPDDALWLLVGDGLGTLGEALPAAGDVPVFAATGATEADRALLRHLATATGGALLDLVAQDAPRAVAQLRAGGVRVVGVTATPAGAVADVQLVAGVDPSSARVTGRLLAPQAELTLVLAERGREVERRRITVRRDAAAAPAGGPGPVAVSWAQGRAEVLGLFPDRNEAELLALGRRFGIVTAGTSFLVLESLEQHLQYGVEPAATRPELRARYLAAVDDRLQLRRAEERQALEEVAAEWKARVAWWEAKHEVPAGWRWREEPKKSASGALRSRRGDDADVMLEREEAPMAGAAARPAPAPLAAAKVAPDEAKGEGGTGSAQASIAIQPWDPAVPWLAALKAAPPGKAYEVYLAEKAKHAGPGFYLDCAGFFLRAGDRAHGLRVLTNLAELRLDDAALLRVLAWRLSEAGELDAAVEILSRVLRLRPEEPQSRRDLALVLADRAEAQDRAADAGRAVALLWEVGRQRWPNTADIEIVSLTELNRILARAGRRGWAEVEKAAPIDPRLRRNLDLDVRISLSWDADATDVDLHVTEPTGEHAFYGHQATRMGGLVSHDVTTGYGPEEYVVRRALPGPYDIRVHYYGSHQQTLVGPATLIATVYTNWGRPDEKRQVLTLRLDGPRDLERIGVVTVQRAQGQGALVKE